MIWRGGWLFTSKERKALMLVGLQGNGINCCPELFLTKEHCFLLRWAMNQHFSQTRTLFIKQNIYLISNLLVEWWVALQLFLMFAVAHICFFLMPFSLIQVGKALFDGQLLDVHFTRSFYKHILGVKVTYHDIEAIDPDYFKNLKWMLEASAFFCSFSSSVFSPLCVHCEFVIIVFCFWYDCRMISAMFWVLLLALMQTRKNWSYMNEHRYCLCS